MTTTTTITLTPDLIARMNTRFSGQTRPGAIIKLAVGDDRPAAGWYLSSTGDITLDGNVEFNTEQTIEGLITHEASHSVWSNWLTIEFMRSGTVTMAELDVIKLLEEARIEAHAVNSCHTSRRRLRACYNHLLADGFSKPENFESVAGAVTCWALAWGRVHSGVVDPDELIEIDKLMRTRFGDFPVDMLDDLLGEFCTLSFGNYAGRPGIGHRAKDIAAEWLEILKSLQDNEGECEGDDVEGELGRMVREILGEESEGTAGEGSGSGEDGEESDEGEGSGSGEGEGDDEAEGESSGSGDGESDDEAGGTPGHGDGGSEKRYGWTETFGKAVEGVSKDPDRTVTERRMSTRDKLARIWNKNRKGKDYNGELNWRDDEPTAEHHRMVTRMAKALERDATPAVVRTRVKSQLPPGRLNGRGALAGAADRAGGRMTTAEAWRSNKRHHVERPPVIIGVATDTSGSMADYETMLGEAAWVMAHAGKRVNAKFAAVTFGVDAEPVVALGEQPKKIRVRSANSGHEAFDDAMAALDGPLRLTEKGIIGRKVLIVVSDAHFVRDGEVEKTLLWLKALRAGGTDVIWVGAEQAKKPGAYECPVVRIIREDKFPGIKMIGRLGSAEEFVTAVLDNLRAA